MIIYLFIFVFFLYKFSVAVYQDQNQNLIFTAKVLTLRIQKLQNLQLRDPKYDWLEASEKNHKKLETFRVKIKERFKWKLQENPGWKTLFENYLIEEDLIITKYAILCKWDINTLVVQKKFPFPNLHELFYILPKSICVFCYYNPSDQNPTFSLSCGHSICLYCVEENVSLKHYYNSRSIICCVCSCSNTLDSDIYLQAAPHTVYKHIDFFKIPEIPFYFKDSKTLYKKCPRLSCSMILKVENFSDAKYHRYSNARCSDGHVFCVYCSASFDHSPMRCEELLGDHEDCQLPWPTIFLPPSTQDVDAPIKECRMCGFLMEKMQLSGEEKNIITMFFDESVTLVCRKCKYIATDEDQSSTCPFNEAMLLQQAAIYTNDLALIPFVNVLKDSFLCLFLTFCFSMKKCQKSYYNGGNEKFEIFFMYYVAIFENHFKKLTLAIQNFKTNRSDQDFQNMQAISDQMETQLETHRKCYSMHTIFYLARLPVFQKINRFDFNERQKSLFKDAQNNESLQIFTANYQLLKEVPCCTVTSVVSQSDPLEIASENLQKAIFKSAKIRNLLGKKFRCNFQNFDYVKMARVASLSSTDAIARLEDDMQSFLTECHVDFSVLCLTENCSQIIEELLFPPCKHNLLCKDCLITAVREKINHRQWNHETGLIKCFQSDCFEYFDTRVTQFLLTENSEACRKYADFIYKLHASFASSIKVEVECAACCEVFEYDEFNFEACDNEENISEFRRKQKLFLLTVECPYCRHKMCANCEQQTLHYSAPCGILLTSVEDAQKNMCPNCKCFFKHSKNNASSFCIECSFDFCTACGVENSWNQNCANRSYICSEKGYTESKEISFYSIQCKYFLNKLFDIYQSYIARTLLEYDFFTSSNNEIVCTLAKIICESLLICNWYRFLYFYIDPLFYCQRKDNFLNFLSKIEEKAKYCLSLLKRNLLDECAAACEDLVGSLELHDEILKPANISNQFILHNVMQLEECFFLLPAAL